MRPLRKAAYCLVALIIGVGAAIFGILGGPGMGALDGKWPLLFGFLVWPAALLLLVQALLAARGQALLLAGQDVIARWHVSAAEWERFRELDGRRRAEHRALGNDLWIRKVTPPAGVDVIVGKKSLLVDGSYHVLRRRGLPGLRGVRWLDASPICLEFSLLYPRGKHGRSMPLTLRIPVPRGSVGDAQRVVEHYEPICRRGVAIALRNPPKTYRVCLGLFVLAVAMGGIGYAVATGVADDADPLAPVLLLVGGVGVGAFALILALATFLVTRRHASGL